MAPGSRTVTGDRVREPATTARLSPAARISTALGLEAPAHGGFETSQARSVPYTAVDTPAATAARDLRVAHAAQRAHSRFALERSRPHKIMAATRKPVQRSKIKVAVAGKRNQYVEYSKVSGYVINSTEKTRHYQSHPFKSFARLGDFQNAENHYKPAIAEESKILFEKLCSDSSIHGEEQIQARCNTLSFLTYVQGLSQVYALVGDADYIGPSTGGPKCLKKSGGGGLVAMDQLLEARPGFIIKGVLKIPGLVKDGRSKATTDLKVVMDILYEKAMEYYEEAETTQGLEDFLDTLNELKKKFDRTCNTKAYDASAHIRGTPQSLYAPPQSAEDSDRHTDTRR